MATFKMMCLLVAVAAFVIGARAKEAECTNSVVATLQEKVSQVTTDVNSNLSADTSEKDAQLASLANSLTEAAESLSAIQTILNNSLAAQRAAAAAAVASAGSGGTPAITLFASVPGANANCGTTKAKACPAVYHSDDDGAEASVVVMLVRTPGGAFYGAKGVYTCEYTMSTTDAKVIAPAILVDTGGEKSGAIHCQHPVQAEGDTSKASWSATVVATEAGTAIGIDKSSKYKSTTVYFRSEGPYVSVNGLGGEDGKTVGFDIDEDVKDNKFVVMLEVTDRDTAADKVEVTATAKVTKFVTAISIGDPDDGLRAMTLTLDLGFTGGDLASEITVNAVDDHDQTHSTTFKIMQNLAYYASSGGAEMRDAASAKLAKGIISPDGLHCTDLCGPEKSIDWGSAEEQMAYCLGIAQIQLDRVPRDKKTVDGSGFSKPGLSMIGNGNYNVGQCTVNSNAKRMGDKWSGDDNFDFKGSSNDVILCKCKSRTEYTHSGIPPGPEQYEIKKFAFAGSWAEEQAFCVGKGGRLPFTSDVCDKADAKPLGGYCDGKGAGSTSSTTDKWAATADINLGVGEYFGCSSDLMGSDRRGCERHAAHAGGLPGWRNQDGTARWKGWTYCRLDKE